MFTTIDNVLIDYCQRFSNNFQKITGKTCFYLSSILIAVAISLQFAYMAIMMLDGRADIIPSVLITIFSWSMSIYSNYINDRYWENLKNHGSYANPALHSLKTLRVFTLIIAIMITPLPYIFHFQKLAPLFFSLSFYAASIFFSSCTPLPPNKSKIKEWIEKIIKVANTIKEKLSPQPEPAPVGC